MFLDFGLAQTDTEYADDTNDCLHVSHYMFHIPLVFLHIDVQKKTMYHQFFTSHHTSLQNHVSMFIATVMCSMLQPLGAAGSVPSGGCQEPTLKADFQALLELIGSKDRWRGQGQRMNLEDSGEVR